MSCAYLALAERSKLQVRADDDAADVGWFRVDYTRTEDKMRLTLTREDEVLTGEVALKPCETARGREYKLGGFTADGIAFDHSKMIAKAILALTEAGRL